MQLTIDSQRKALDFAIGVARQAHAALRRLQYELAAAQETQWIDWFWPLAFLRGPLLFRRRIRLRKLTARAQADLQALDTAADVLREQGVQLAAPAAGQARRPREPVTLFDAWRGRGRDEWEGPLGVVQNAMRRVEAVATELRRLRG